MSRKEEGRGLASIQESVNTSIKRLEDYMKKHGRRLIIATRKKQTTQISTAKIAWEQKSKKKKGVEISSNKAKSHSRKLGHG